MSAFSFAIIAESHSTLEYVNPSSISNEHGKDDVVRLIVVSSTELDSMIRCGERLWEGETWWKAESLGTRFPLGKHAVH